MLDTRQNEYHNVYDFILKLADDLNRYLLD